MFSGLTETMIIAEIGVNHDGILSKAKELIHAAHECGASLVKYQAFNVESLVGKDSPTPAYQSERLQKTQYEILKTLEFSYSQQEELFSYAQSIGVQLFATPFDLDALHFLVNIMKVPLIKISSGDINNSRLLYSVGSTRLPTILSTGASVTSDIDYALSILFLGRNQYPVPKDLESAVYMADYSSANWMMDGLLHCTSQYPAPFEDLNLNSIGFLSKAYKLPVGLSDHSLGIEACIAAVALGAKILEKHLTLDRKSRGPDHYASLDPHEFSQLVSSVRNIEKAMGEFEKRITPSELSNRNLIRRSVYAAQDITAGNRIDESDLVMLRPHVIDEHPHNYWSLVGSIAKRSFLKGEIVRNL